MKKTTVSGAAWTDKKRMVFADVDGDGLSDFIYLGSDKITTMLGSRTGTLSQPVVSAADIPSADGDLPDTSLKYIDIDGDRRADIVHVAPDAIYVKKGTASGAFGPAVRAATFEYATDWNSRNQEFAYSFGDVNGDRRTDYVMASADTLWVKRGEKDGTFFRMRISKIKPSPVPNAASCVIANASGSVINAAEDLTCLSENDILTAAAVLSLPMPGKPKKTNLPSPMTATAAVDPGANFNPADFDQISPRAAPRRSRRSSYRRRQAGIRVVR